MVDPVSFFKAFGIMFLLTAFVIGTFYWIFVGFKKMFPNYKYYWKYTVMKKKHSEEDIIQLMQYADAKMSGDEVMKLLLLNGFSSKKAKDWNYIYNKILEKEVKNNE